MKRYRAEEIILKLREADVEAGRGKTQCQRFADSWA